MAIYHLSLRHSSKVKGQSAAAKNAYIERTGIYQRDNSEVVAKASAHMPEWAKDDARIFWVAADTHERSNARVCSELEVALPVGISTEDQISLVVIFAQVQLCNQPLTWAIHKGKGTNPHAHIMFSHRVGRDAHAKDVFFKRNGAKKNRELISKDWLEDTRKKWAEHTNIILERYEGIEPISELSLDAQAEEGIEKARQSALANKPDEMAFHLERVQSFDRPPKTKRYHNQQGPLRKYGSYKSKVSFVRTLLNDFRQHLDANKNIYSRAILSACERFMRGIREGVAQVSGMISPEKESSDQPDQAVSQSFEKEVAKAPEKASSKSEDKNAEHEAAAKKAAAIWENIQDWATPDNSEYLKDKGVKGHGIKIDAQGKTLVAVSDIDNNIRSLQIIDESGTERFLRGGQITGNMHLIGKAEEFEKSKDIVIAEDYASGASIRDITKLPVVVAFHAFNVEKVGGSIKDKYPEANLIIASSHGKHNEVFRDAAKSVDAYMMAPDLSKKELNQGLSSWNDVHQSCGDEKTHSAMRAAVRAGNAQKRREQERSKPKAREIDIGLGM